MKAMLAWQGISRQGAHQAIRRMHRSQDDVATAIGLAEQVRREHPRMGCRDIYYARRAKMPRGRDWAEAILRQAGFAAKVRGKASIPGFIVHTDRGRQYTSVEFKSALEKEGLHQSMAQYAWQNVYCERVNRTTKEGYLAFEKNSCIEALQREVTHSVKNYITGKPHRGLTARLNPRVFIRAQANGEYGDYTVKIFSKLTSTKQLYVNKNINLIQASTQISL